MIDFNQIALIDYSSSFHGYHYGLRINEGFFCAQQDFMPPFFRANPLLIALSFHSLITTDPTWGTPCPSFLIITSLFTLKNFTQTFLPSFLLLNSKCNRFQI